MRVKTTCTVSPCGTAPSRLRPRPPPCCCCCCCCGGGGWWCWYCCLLAEEEEAEEEAEPADETERPPAPLVYPL
jgi:hypothetical protein